MHRSQHARAHEERSQQAERECRNGEQYRPALESTALFRHRQGMDQCGTYQPWHERGIFHRIPEPPAAPAQFVIRPQATQCDADGHEYPRHGRPGTRPARPSGIELAAQQGGQRKRECHGETDITHVQHRRMDHQTRVLQQRVQIAPVHRRRQQTIERIGCEQHEQQEAGGDQTHHTDHARHHLLRQMAAECGDRNRPHGKDERPQQQRTFVTAPQRRHAILNRQLRIGMFRNIQYGKIVTHEGVHQTANGDENDDELADRQCACRAHHHRIVACCPDDGQHTLDEGKKQGDDECEITDLWNHAEALKYYLATGYAADGLLLG